MTFSERVIVIIVNVSKIVYTIFDKNDYTFNALQFDCFRMNVKLYRL